MHTHSICCVQDRAPNRHTTHTHTQPLSVELGPGILGNIYDGIQRPLKRIAEVSGDVFIPRGVDVAALDRTAQWEFEPHLKVEQCCV